LETISYSVRLEEREEGRKGGREGNSTFVASKEAVLVWEDAAGNRKLNGLTAGAIKTKATH